MCLILLMSIDVVVALGLVLLKVSLTLLNRIGYNMISIRILSLLTYFTYIFIDIIIYVLVSTS
jgi:hypothetical protein